MSPPRPIAQTSTARRGLHRAFRMTGILALCLAGSAKAEKAGELTASAPFAVAPKCARDGRRLQHFASCAYGKQVYLVAWCDGSRQVGRPTADIYCARIDGQTGRTLDPAGIRICAAAGLQEWSAVAFDGTNFLVVWQDLRNGKDYDVYAARVTQRGKVLDRDGFPVARRGGNQARPAVAFAAGQYLVVWMDARRYPVYGLYGARVTPDGNVLDPNGRALGAEDAATVAKAGPPGRSWLGDRHYWWERLSSRFRPSVAGNGRTCLVTFLRDVHANRTTGHALLVDPRKCAPIAPPVQLSGEPRARLAACATPDGWATAFDHWLSGWTPAPRLACLRLDGSARPRDQIPKRVDVRAPDQPPMLLDVHKLLASGGGGYHQGKGHFAFWQGAAAWNGGHVVLAMDYGWRTPRKPNELNYAVLTALFDVKAGRFPDASPRVLASGDSASGVSVCRPSLAAGPDGRTLVVYEIDRGVDKRTVEACVLRVK